MVVVPYEHHLRALFEGQAVCGGVHLFGEVARDSTLVVVSFGL